MRAPHVFNFVGGIAANRCWRQGTTVNRSFTLVEMLLVVMFISILTSGVVVSFSGRQDRHRLRLATEDLAAAIRFAYREAHIRKVSLYIVFDPTMTSYRIMRVNVADSEDFIPVKGQGGLHHALGKGVQIVGFTTDGATWRILPDSLVFPATGDGFSGTIELANRRNESTRIEVFSETGQVYVTR